MLSLAFRCRGPGKIRGEFERAWHRCVMDGVPSRDKDRIYKDLSKWIDRVAVDHGKTRTRIAEYATHLEVPNTLVNVSCKVIIDRADVRTLTREFLEEKVGVARKEVSGMGLLVWYRYWLEEVGGLTTEEIDMSCAGGGVLKEVVMDERPGSRIIAEGDDELWVIEGEGKQAVVSAV